MIIAGDRPLRVSSLHPMGGQIAANKDRWRPGGELVVTIFKQSALK